MVKIWRNRVWAGTQVLASCPAKYRGGVIAMMQDDLEGGAHSEADLKKLVEGGTVTAAEYEEITGGPYEG